jgi:hypothetical protein
MTLESDFRDDGVRVLRAVDLLEVSCVAIPANSNAVITDVKSFDRHSSDVQVAVREWLERVKSGADTRAKDGRDISEARRNHMAAVSGSLREAVEAVDALLAPPPPPEVINVGQELRRRRMERAGIMERPA